MRDSSLITSSVLPKDVEAGETETGLFLDRKNHNVEISDILGQPSPRKGSLLDLGKPVEWIQDAEIVQTITSDLSGGSEKKKGWRQYIGIGCAVGSSICFSIVLLLVKMLDKYHPLSLAVHRHWGNVIPSIPVLLYYRYWKKVPLFDEIWPICSKDSKQLRNFVGLCVRGCLGATCVALRFYSLEYLTIADSTVVTYSGPIVIIVLAHFCLKEELSFVAIMTGLFMLLGVVFIARPPFLTNASFDLNNFIGICIVMVLVLLGSIVTILVRKIRKLHFAVMQLFFGTWGLAQCAIVAYSFGVMSFPTGTRDISLTILLAGLSFFGQLFNILALKFEDAGVIGLVRVVDVLFSFMWTLIFLKVVPDIYSVLGGVIICLGVMIIGFRKVIGTLPEENRTRQRFRLILK